MTTATMTPAHMLTSQLTGLAVHLGIGQGLLTLLQLIANNMDGGSEDSVAKLADNAGAKPLTVGFLKLHGGTVPLAHGDVKTTFAVTVLGMKSILGDATGLTGTTTVKGQLERLLDLANKAIQGLPTDGGATRTPPNYTEALTHLVAFVKALADLQEPALSLLIAPMTSLSGQVIGEV